MFLNEKDIADFEIMSNFSNNVFGKAEFESTQNSLGKPDDRFLVKSTSNLIVNLEDILVEEQILNDILNSIYSKSLVSALWSEWWAKTEKSSVKQMEIFFEEQNSKRLMKYFQVLLCLFIWFLEINESKLYSKNQTWINAKTVIKNLHRNYLVFIEFILNNLTSDQFEFAKEWAEKLQKLLKTRSVMKQSISLFNSDILEKNNNISTTLVKDLIRLNWDQNEYK